MITREQYEYVKDLLDRNDPTKPGALTQQEIANMARLHRTTIAKIQAGWGGPPRSSESRRIDGRVYTRCLKCRNLVEGAKCRICESRKDRDRNAATWKPTLSPVTKSEPPNQQGMDGACSICGSGPITLESQYRWRCANCHNVCEWCPTAERVVSLCELIKTGRLVIDRD